MVKFLFLIMLAPPGGGKGTQADILSTNYKIPHISTGNLLRNNPKLSPEAKEIIAKGELIPDNIMLDIVKAALNDAKTGWILDGFPRTLPQAKALRELLEVPPIAIYLNISDETIKKRLGDRRTCIACSTIYHLVANPSKKPGVCDKCGGKLVVREDDKPEVVANRLKVYYEKTAPLIDFYRKGSRFIEIDASGDKSPSEVFGSIVDALSSLK